MRRPASQAPELPGYSAERLLGSGGFADVFLYEQKLPRRKVAVKVLIADDLTRATRAQFVAEANLMAQLSAHPFIVTIFHADIAGDGRPYFVMEYCSGPSLAERYKREPFGVEDALRTGVRLSGAIATAHAAGILHRDIKPANVLTNDYGWPALTDFGIASDLEGGVPVHTVTVTTSGGGESATGQSAVGMSVPWSAPEMFEDDPRPDPRTDQFALAATIHTLLAGRTPFEVPGRSNGALDLIGRIERGAVTPIGRTDVPLTLQHVLAKGMSSNREERYPSVVEFARALQRVELELGYAATPIEVPNLHVTERAESAPDDADATRARSVQVVSAQPAAPTVGVAGAVPAPPVDGTVVRGAVRAVASEPDAVDATVVRRRSPQADAPAARGEGARASESDTIAEAAPRRSRVGLVVGVVAAVVVAAVVVIAVLVGAHPGGPAPTQSAAPPDEAVIAATVPVPVVQPGVRAADGSVAFAVSHRDAKDGDQYRWRRSDGSGGVAVANGPTITVTGATAGQKVCIDVQVQRGSKTSESTTGCTP